LSFAVAICSLIFFKDIQFRQATLRRPVILNCGCTYPLGVRNTKIVRDARPENKKNVLSIVVSAVNFHQKPWRESPSVLSFL